MQETVSNKVMGIKFLAAMEDMEQSTFQGKLILHLWVSGLVKPVDKSEVVLAQIITRLGRHQTAR